MKSKSAVKERLGYQRELLAETEKHVKQNLEFILINAKKAQLLPQKEYNEVKRTRKELITETNRECIVRLLIKELEWVLGD